MKKKTLSFQLEKKLDDRLEKIAKKQDRSKSYLIREAVEKFLKTQKYDIIKD